MSVRSPDPLIGGKSPRKVVILRALQLGDLLCAGPGVPGVPLRLARG